MTGKDKVKTNLDVVEFNANKLVAGSFRSRKIEMSKNFSSKILRPVNLSNTKISKLVSKNQW